MRRFGTTKGPRYKVKQLLRMEVPAVKPGLVTSTPMQVAEEKPQTHIPLHIPNQTKKVERLTKASPATLKQETPIQTCFFTMPHGYKPPAFIQPASPLPPKVLPFIKKTLPKSTKHYRVRRDQALMEGRQKRKYKPRTGPMTCRKCNKKRDDEQHQQYYGTWYCKRTNQEPFEEWIQERKKTRNDRKKTNIARAPDSQPPTVTVTVTTPTRASDSPPSATIPRSALGSSRSSVTITGTTDTREPDSQLPSVTIIGTTTTRASVSPPSSPTRSGTTPTRASDSPPSGTTPTRVPVSPPSYVTITGTTTTRVRVSPQDSPPSSVTIIGTTTTRATDSQLASITGTIIKSMPDPPLSYVTRSETTPTRASDSPPSGTNPTRASDSQLLFVTRSGTTTTRASDSPSSGTNPTRAPDSQLPFATITATPTTRATDSLSSTRSGTTLEKEFPVKAGRAYLKQESPLQTGFLTMPPGYKPPAFILPASLLNPRILPSVKTSIPRSTKCSRARRDRALMEGRQMRKYKPRTGPVTCRKCNNKRDDRQHHQYFGIWYCKRTNQEPFDEWIQERKKTRDDRKKTNSLRAPDSQPPTVSVTTTTPTRASDSQPPGTTPTSLPDSPLDSPPSSDTRSGTTTTGLPDSLSSTRSDTTQEKEFPVKADRANLNIEPPLQTFFLTMPPGYKPPAFIQPASPLTPKILPSVTTSTPRSTICSRARRARALMEGRQMRKYKPRTGPVTCRKCNQKRDDRQHHQYFGIWYCERTNQEPFEEWIQERKNKINDRKKQKKE